MKRLTRHTLKTTGLLGLLALISACGQDVHSIGVTMGCGIDSSPYLGADDTVSVRCGPQSQSPYQQVN